MCILAQRSLQKNLHGLKVQYINVGAHTGIVLPEAQENLLMPILLKWPNLEHRSQSPGNVIKLRDNEDRWMLSQM